MRYALLAVVLAAAGIGGAWASGPGVAGWVLQAAGGSLGVCPVVSAEVW